MKRRIALTIIALCAAGLLYAFYQAPSLPAFGAATFASDNKTIIFSYHRGGHCYLYRAHIGQEAVVRLTNVSDGCEEGPSFSADGKLIAYSYAKPGARTSQIYVANADGTNPREITKSSGDNDDICPVFAPSSDRVFFMRSGFFGNYDGINPSRRHKFNAYSTDLAGNLKQLTAEDFYEASCPTLSPDGRSLAFKVFDYQQKGDAFVEYSTSGMNKSPIATWRPEAGDTPLGRTYGDFLFLPDGKSAILTAASTGKSGSYDYNFYRLNLSDQKVEQLTTDNGYVTEAHVSPNGKLVLFSRVAIRNRSFGESSLHLLDISSHKISALSLSGMQ